MKKIFFLLIVFASLAQRKNSYAMEDEQTGSRNNRSVSPVLFCTEIVSDSPFKPTQGHQSPGKAKVVQQATSFSKSKARLFEAESNENTIFSIETVNNEFEPKKRKRLYTLAEKIERNEQIVGQILKNFAENAERENAKYETAISILATLATKKRNDKFINEIKKFIGRNESKSWNSWQ